MKFDKKFIALIFILLISCMLRFYKLGSVPNSLNADEVAIGYNAYSLLKTSKDEYGKKLPLLFQSFDDYKMPVYIYLTVPSIAVFGLNDFSVRLPSAVFGVATVYATYLLAEVLLASSVVALIAAFFLAISPWHLQFSRSAYEANIAVFFAVLGIMMLLRGLKKQKYLIPAFFSLALSVWSYHSARVFIPLMIFGFCIIYFKELMQKKIYIITGLIIFAALCLPLLLLSISPEGLVRARGVSALGDPALLGRIVSWRIVDEAKGIPFSNIFHNHRLPDISVIVKGYLAHYDLNFFFSEIVQGKYHAPGIGLLYLWELPILIYGLYITGGSKGKSKYLLFLWFLVAPLAASPTRMLPHPVRTLVFLPTLQIFVAIGLFELYNRVGYKKITRIFGSVIIFFFCLYYLHQYYVHLPVDYALEWQYGHKQVVDSVYKLQDKYKKIIVSTSLDQPYIFFLYHLRYDPEKYLASGGTVSGKFDEERNAFDKYEFHSYLSTTVIAQDTLYVGTPSEQLTGMNALIQIKDPSGIVVYNIYGK